MRKVPFKVSYTVCSPQTVSSSEPVYILASLSKFAHMSDGSMTNSYSDQYSASVDEPGKENMCCSDQIWVKKIVILALHSAEAWNGVFREEWEVQIPNSKHRRCTCNRSRSINRFTLAVWLRWCRINCYCHIDHHSNKWMVWRHSIQREV